MFTRETLSKAVEMQHKSYLLLQWVEKAIERNVISTTSSHEYMSMAEVAKEWIAEHYLNIPKKCRPEQHDIEPFSKMFSSYLSTSFDLIEHPGKILYSEGAHCFCPMCSYLINAPHLKPKKLSKKDKKRAQKLKAQYVEKLSLHLHIPLSSRDIQRLIHDKDLQEMLALTTYADELLLRIQGHTEGSALLALWREFAWDVHGSPKKKFELTVDSIMNAEQQLIDVIQHMKTEQHRGDEPTHV